MAKGYILFNVYTFCKYQDLIHMGCTLSNTMKIRRFPMGSPYLFNIDMIKSGWLGSLLVYNY